MARDIGRSPSTTRGGLSQCARILAVLADRQPHQMEAIHAAVGTCRLNSRIAELRSRGYEIVCDKTGGVYKYTLLASPGDLLDEPAAAAPSPGAVADSPVVAAGSSSGPTDADTSTGESVARSLTLFPDTSYEAAA